MAPSQALNEVVMKNKINHSDYKEFNQKSTNS